MNRVGLIYKATDNKLNKSYIGQTLTTLENRKKQHLKNAFNKNDKTYFTMFYKMLRILGKDSFTWEILENYIPQEKLNEKEIYYINKYDTYENGYNEGPGGQLTHSSILTESQVLEIIKLLKTNITLKSIAEKFSVTREVISDINCGETWFNASINYPIRPQGFNKKINFSDIQINEMIILLKDSNKSYKEIAKYFNCVPATIKKINDGIHYRIDGQNYPIRKKCFSHLDNNNLKDIVNLLLNTNKTQLEISKELNINRKNITNINRGTYHKKEILKIFPDITFPIRNNN